MDQNLQFKQSSHLHPALSDPTTRRWSADKLIGRWLNTSRETQGLAEFVIEQDGDRFSVSAVGVGTDGPIDWPRTRGKPLANLEEEAGQRAPALAATFDESLPQEPDARALAEFLRRRRRADPLRFPDLSLAVVKLMGSGDAAKSKRVMEALMKMNKLDIKALKNA